MLRPYVMSGGKWCAAIIGLATFGAGVPALAQTQSPAAAPQALPPPPPGYVYVPASSVAEKAEKPAPELAYREGEPIPAGYRLEEKPIRGLVIAGYIVSAIPYGIGVMVATGSQFANRTEMLLVPYLGPWLTLGTRESSACSRSDGEEGSGLGCLGDALAVSFLVMDGVMQAAGGGLLLGGYLGTRKRLVYEQSSWSWSPGMVGTGYGLRAGGVF
jgi:hypothetical protein